MVLVRVHAPGRYKAEQMTRAAGLAKRSDQFPERRYLGKATVLDRLADARQFLHHHTSSADVQMPDLGISHLTRRQPDIEAGGAQESVRAGGPEPVEIGSATEPDRIVRLLLPPAPAIEHDQHHRSDRRRIGHWPRSRALRRDLTPLPGANKDVRPWRAARALSRPRHSERTRDQARTWRRLWRLGR